MEGTLELPNRASPPSCCSGFRVSGLGSIGFRLHACCASASCVKLNRVQTQAYLGIALRSWVAVEEMRTMLQYYVYANRCSKYGVCIYWQNFLLP